MKWLFLVVGLCLLTSAEPEKTLTDQDKLQGEWEMVGLEIREAQVPAEKLKGTTLTIKDDLYITHVKKTDHEIRYKLDPKQDPKQIDMIFPDGTNAPKVAKGIYKIDGDKLIICRAQQPDQDRPTNFVSSSVNDTFVVTWQKLPPKDAKTPPK